MVMVIKMIFKKATISMLNDIYRNYGFKRQPLDKENNNFPYDCNLWELTI